MTRLGILALALAACGQTDLSDDDSVDAPPVTCDGACELDAAQDGDAGDGGVCFGTCPAVDAAGGTLPINAACEPLLDQCAPGLTCRIRDAHDGICRTAGALLEGQVCTSVDQCGPNLACLSAGAGVLRCFLVCDVGAPALRCTSSQTCIRYWGDDTGVCG